MGRYTEPYFDCEANVVSVWLANVEYREIPENYWVVIEDFDDDDDESVWNQFSADFGFGSYEIDCVESFFDEYQFEKVSVYNLIKHLSYSKSFITTAVTEAEKFMVKESSYIYVIYNFDYMPFVSKIKSNHLFTFIGSFEFDSNSEPVENYFTNS